MKRVRVRVRVRVMVRARVCILKCERSELLEFPIHNLLKSLFTLKMILAIKHCMSLKQPSILQTFRAANFGYR